MEQEREKIGGLVGGTARFLGIEELGTRIGSELVRFTPEGQDLERIKREGGISEEEYGNITSGGVTNSETLGSALQFGLSLALATGKIAGLGIRAGAKLGAAYGATEAIKEKEGLIPKVIVGGVMGGLTGGLLSAASRGIQSVVTKKASLSLAQKTLKQTPKDLALEKTGRKPELAKQFLRKGTTGSREAIVEDASANLARLEKELQVHLQRSQKTTIDAINVIRATDNLAIRKRNVYGQKGVELINEYKKFLLSKGIKIPVKDAHTLTRDIYKELGDSAFNKDVLPQNRDLLRTIAGALRKEIGKTSMRANSIIKEEQYYIRVLDNLERQINKKAGLNVLGLQDTIFAAGTLATGEPAILATGIAKRAIESPQLLTRASVGLSKLGDVMSKVPAGISAPIKQTAYNIPKNIQGQLSDMNTE